MMLFLINNQFPKMLKHQMILKEFGLISTIPTQLRLRNLVVSLELGSNKKNSHKMFNILQLKELDL